MVNYLFLCYKKQALYDILIFSSIKKYIGVDNEIRQ